MKVLFNFVATILLVAIINQTLAEDRVATGRIHGGRPIVFGERTDYKHQVKLITTIGGRGFGCGGSILTDRIILTAGHCVFHASQSQVYFGLFNQNELEDAVSTQIVPFANIRIHEQYDNDTLVNDIAILKTPNRIQFSDIVGPISLPENTDKCTGYAGAPVIISGWGTTSDTPATSRATILKTAQVDVGQLEECKNAWGSAYDPNAMICSKSSDAGVCQGDSGGPMVLNIGGNKYVIGITSFSTTGCEHDYKRVFTCIVSHLKWIDLNMN